MAAKTELKATAMILARAKQGTRIADGGDAIFQDGETLWACGYVDRQEVGYMYLGDL